MKDTNQLCFCRMKECKSGQHLDQALLCQPYLRDDGCCHCGQVDQKYHDWRKTINIYLSTYKHI